MRNRHILIFKIFKEKSRNIRFSRFLLNLFKPNSNLSSAENNLRQGFFHVLNDSAQFLRNVRQTNTMNLKQKLNKSLP